MLERLQVQNFQCHKRLDITFAPDVTTIVGPSDVGKSAALRALRWLATNQPGGQTFVRQGAKGTTVKLWVDGTTCTRKRAAAAGGENTYAVGGQTLKAFGRGVPEGVEALLALGPTTWQLQHDGPFWLSLTPGEVAKQLNAVVDLSVIDETLAHVARATTRASTRLQVLEDELEEAMVGAKASKWAVGFDRDLRAVEAAEDAAATAQANHQRAASLLAQAHQQATQAAQAKQRHTAAQAAAKACRVANAANHRAYRLQHALAAARQLQAAASNPPPPVQPLAAARAAWGRASAQAQRLGCLLEEVRTLEAVACKKEEKLRAAVLALPTKCPTCGRS